MVSRIFRNFMASLRLRGQDPAPKLMGQDFLGNSYYEAEGNTTSEHTHLRKTRRFVMVPGQQKLNKWSHEGAPIPEVPHEWETWLRNRRPDPPTEKELRRNIGIMRQTQSKAAELEEKYARERVQLVKDGLIAESPNEDDRTKTTGTDFPSYQGFEHIPGTKATETKDVEDNDKKK